MTNSNFKSSQTSHTTHNHLQPIRLQLPFYNSYNNNSIQIRDLLRWS